MSFAIRRISFPRREAAFGLYLNLPTHMAGPWLPHLKGLLKGEMEITRIDFVLFLITIITSTLIFYTFPYMASALPELSACLWEGYNGSIRSAKEKGQSIPSF